MIPQLREVVGDVAVAPQRFLHLPRHRMGVLEATVQHHGADALPEQPIGSMFDSVRLMTTASAGRSARSTARRRTMISWATSSLGSWWYRTNSRPNVVMSR